MIRIPLPSHRTRESGETSVVSFQINIKIQWIAHRHQFLKANIRILDDCGTNRLHFPVDRPERYRRWYSKRLIQESDEVLLVPLDAGPCLRTRRYCFVILSQHHPEPLTWQTSPSRSARSDHHSRCGGSLVYAWNLILCGVGFASPNPNTWKTWEGIWLLNTSCLSEISAESPMSSCHNESESGQGLLEHHPSKTRHLFSHLFRTVDICCHIFVSRGLCIDPSFCAFHWESKAVHHNHIWSVDLSKH